MRFLSLGFGILVVTLNVAADIPRCSTWYYQENTDTAVCTPPASITDPVAVGGTAGVCHVGRECEEFTGGAPPAAGTYASLINTVKSDFECAPGDDTAFSVCKVIPPCAITYEANTDLGICTPIADLDQCPRLHQ